MHEEEYVNKIIAFVQNLAARPCLLYSGTDCLKVNGKAFCIPCEARAVIAEEPAPETVGES